MDKQIQPASNHPAANPFNRMLAETGGINVGAVAIESERAIAEAQGKLVLAKRFPRDTVLAKREALEAAKDYDLASVAFYALPRGDETIEGPTIKLAEELARCWGNIDYGHRELSRTEGKSEVEVYAWDTQTNTTSTRQLTVMHSIDLSGGKSRPTRSQKEIDDLVARKASAQLRGRILAVLPKALVQATITACRQTLEGGNGVPLAERLEKMVDAFGKIGVTPEMLIKRLGHPLDKTTPEELVDMIGVFTSIREGHFTVEDQFPADEPSPESTESARVQAMVENQQKAAAKPAPRQAKAQADKKEAPQQAAQAQPDPAKEPSQPAAEKAEPSEQQKALTEEKDGTVAKEREPSPAVQPAAQSQASTGDVF